MYIEINKNKKDIGIVKLTKNNLQKKLDIKDIGVINIILEYNKALPILSEDGEGFCINARDLHSQLKVGRDYSAWIKGRIKKYEFIENVDYKTIRNNNNLQGGRPKQEYFLTLDIAIFLCELEKYSETNSEIIKYLYSFKNKNTKLIIKGRNRKEIDFIHKLEESLKPFNIQGVKQFYVFKGKYRIDYYIPQLKIAIEYDELQHKNKSNVINDKIRQEEIEKELKCKFIRVSIENSDEYNIGFIIKEIFDIEINKNI
mgnify:CR=1 FL=1